jgi:gliding motility-associated protein GldM
MYLVLTALLALNVSSEILNAFKTIDQSLTNANVIIQKKNQDIYTSLAAKLNDPKTAEKATIWAPKANKAKVMADEMYAYVESLKLALKEESGLEIKDGKETFKEDNLDATTRLFLNKKAGVSKGEELFNKLKQFKQDLAEIDPAIAKEVIPTVSLDLTIPKSNNVGAKNDWAYAYFNMTPTIAAITILTKFQNDIRNTEAQVVEYCHVIYQVVLLSRVLIQVLYSMTMEMLTQVQHLHLIKVVI